MPFPQDVKWAHRARRNGIRVRVNVLLADGTGARTEAPTAPLYDQHRIIVASDIEATVYLFNEANGLFELQGGPILSTLAGQHPYIDHYISFVSSVPGSNGSLMICFGHQLTDYSFEHVYTSVDGNCDQVKQVATYEAPVNLWPVLTAPAAVDSKCVAWIALQNVELWQPACSGSVWQLLLRLTAGCGLRCMQVLSSSTNKPTCMPHAHDPAY